MSTPTRRYSSSLRARQAAQTRSDVLLAAMRLFAADGWAKTTLQAVASQAGVSVETVYKGWGSKKSLLRAAMDVAIVGDAEPVPLLEREGFVRLLDAPPAERLRGGVALLAGLYAGPLRTVWAAMNEAAAGDREVAGWCEEHEERRRSTLAEWLVTVYGRPCDDTTLDSLWVQGSLEVFTKLTVERRWSSEQWASWYVARVEDALGAP
ncbi:TetR/AcrR family transcriptional regulator [Nocardioides rubriscoriae]|uniref:TetR/AcrR family transcriptional regulator n=1 Tax=Nocardioides rubriscoriae TaxID=642762 RepID=UPI0014782517|nr:TetR/AcrR family transcriptional regulator [Nocardioides rubriscoriae]